LLVTLLFLRCFLCAVAGAVSSGGGEVWADVVGSCVDEGVGSEVVGGIEGDVVGREVVGGKGGGAVGLLRWATPMAMWPGPELVGDCDGRRDGGVAGSGLIGEPVGSDFVGDTVGFTVFSFVQLGVRSGSTVAKVVDPWWSATLMGAWLYPGRPATTWGLRWLVIRAATWSGSQWSVARAVARLGLLRWATPMAMWPGPELVGGCGATVTATVG